MTFINPLANVLPAAAVAQQQLADDKVRQIRRAQALERDIAAEDDRLEHQVESTEALSPIDPEARGRNHPDPWQLAERKNDDTESDDPPHIDVTA